MFKKQLYPIELVKYYYNISADVLNGEKISSMDEYVQHGNTSCLYHSVAVAYYSLALVNIFKIRCDRKSLVTGALLHDYFLYDWHENDASHRLHGFRHPKTALNNACRDYSLNEIEKNIISRHMFPLIPIPPRHIEGVIVCLVDKVCSLYETFSRRSYSAIEIK